jgi:hypothetical protein
MLQQKKTNLKAQTNIKFLFSCLYFCAFSKASILVVRVIFAWIVRFVDNVQLV